MWKYIAERDRLRMTIWRMRMVSGYLRLQTQSQYVIHIDFTLNSACKIALQFCVRRTLPFLSLLPAAICTATSDNGISGSAIKGALKGEMMNCERSLPG